MKRLLALYILLTLFHGASLSQSINGDSVGSVNMVDSKRYRQGLWIEKNGDKGLKKSYYINDKKEGVESRSGNNGIKRYQITFQNGIAEGMATFYHPNGVRKELGYWKSNLWQGAYYYFNEDGEFTHRWMFDENGNRSGINYDFHKNGIVKSASIYKNGISICQAEYDSLGMKLKYEYYIDNYELNGIAKFYEEVIEEMAAVENRAVLRLLKLNEAIEKQHLLKQENLLKDVALRERQMQRNAFIGGFAFMFLFAGVFLAQRNSIRKGKVKSDELLLNILPSEVADELKAKGYADAKQFDEVTVLFTDFKGFTALSEKVTPKELVDDLNVVFSEFDRICTKYGIEKIKTIGDAYMAAGGLPTPNSTHAIDVTRTALEMRDIVEAGKAQKIRAGLPYFEVRIGIHTGQVVAGIVGVKKFAYDIWGDTVNTASRMESSGQVGKVNISEATYMLVKDDFACEFRGEVEAKGKGKLGMYFVEPKA